MSPPAVRIILGATLLAFLLVVALIGPWVWPVDPNEIHEGRARAGPSIEQPLGADQLGRDVAARVIHGARISLAIALSGVSIATLLGTGIGLFSGYFRGSFDRLAMRFVDGFNSLPQIMLVILLAGLAGTGSAVLVAVVIGVSTWTVTARLVRAETLSVTSRDFVVHARSVGSGTLRIFVRHVLPQLGSLVIVTSSQRVSGAILLEASLGFLGLGLPVETPTWGRMIAEGTTELASAWWISLFPGLALTLAAMAFSFLGDGLRDWMAFTGGRFAPHKQPGGS